MPTLAIVGLGPSDASLVTLGALDKLRAAPRVAAIGVPLSLAEALRERGVSMQGHNWDAQALLHGAPAACERFAVWALEGDAVAAVPGHPLVDVPGLPNILRALDAVGIRPEIVAGVPNAALTAAASASLVPLPEAHHSWDELVGIMARLRAMCPWDREQTHATLLPYLIEEAHEVVEAVDESDPVKLCGELGDLLLQIVFHAQIATESGRFTVRDVIDALANKMIRRHPHVFGDANIETVDEQMRSWELIKTQEAGHVERTSLLDGIPKSLPALLQAQRVQEKAATVGFDWPKTDGVIDKLDEELVELREAVENAAALRGDERVREELGDVLFTIVNLARRLGIDAEAALRAANSKFRARFGAMEAMAGGGSTALAGHDATQLDDLWNAVKADEARQVS